jgi:hypothetical protein
MEEKITHQFYAPDPQARAFFSGNSNVYVMLQVGCQCHGGQVIMDVPRLITKDAP